MASPIESKPTLLCVFVHGFKGDDNTFGGFPAHLKALLQNALPTQDVRIAVYPRFDTRGELANVVASFRDWLQTQVIDIEVAKQTSSPTVNPSVQVALIGHSMGGIVIADTLLSIAQETVIGGSPDDLPSTENSSQDPRMKSDPAPPLLFPRILCLLAFDTPYLGISPGVLSHGVEQHYSTATSAYSALSTIWPGTSSKQAPTPPASSHAAIKAPPPQAAAAAVATGGSSWTRSLLYGATALTAAGLAAGVAYASREHISRAATASRATFSTGYEFASSHMLFVGTLVKPEVLKRRLAGMRQVGGERGIPWACLYTVLGSGAGAGAKKSGVGTEGERRTFCNLPAGKLGDAEGLGGGGLWVPALNEKAVDAVAAHTGMFFPAENPNYYALAEKSKELIASWMEKSIPL